MPWRRILYFIGLAIGLALFARQTWLGYQTWQKQAYIFVQPSYLIAALGCYVVGYIVQISAWIMIMRYLNAPLTFAQAWQGYLLAFLPRYIPGVVWGYLSRNEWLAQKCGIGYATSSVASLLEVTTLLLTAFSIAAIYWVALPLRFLVASVCGLLLVLNWWLIPLLIQRLGKEHWQVQPKHPQFLLLWLIGNGLYFFFWGLQGAAILFVNTALGIPHPLMLTTSIFSASLAWSIGFLVLFVPAGLGIRETTLATLLNRYGAVPLGQANNLAIFSRLLLIGAELCLVILILPIQIKRWRRTS